MRIIDHAYRTLYAELVDRAFDAAFSSDFDVGGRFVPVGVKGSRYWYHDSADGHGGKTRRYLGPADDPEVTGRVERFNDLKADARSRRRLVSTLVREAYLPRPDKIAGDIVQALASAGLFRLRGVLVGSVAFGAYPALLGVRLPGAVMQTGDADFEQFHSISAAVGDRIPPVGDLLTAIDATFHEIPHIADGRQSTRWAARPGYRVEFLTPNTGSDERDGHPAPMPALGGASAEPLRFLDFLIYEPVRAVLLHGAGIPVLVPSPARFAVHKLMVASRRRRARDSAAKAGKDLVQAAALIDALFEQRFGDDLAEAWIEAWGRGPAWRAALRESLGRIEGDPAIRARLAGVVARFGADATALGF